MAVDEDKVVQMDPNQKRALADLAERPDQTLHKRTANHLNVTEQWLEPGSTEPKALMRHYMAGQYISRNRFLQLKEMGHTDEEARGILREQLFADEPTSPDGKPLSEWLETEEELAERAIRESVVHHSETYNIVEDNYYRLGRLEGLNYRRGEPIDWGG